MKILSSQNAATQILRGAHQFFLAHSNKNGISRTFGYFTHHRIIGVSRLNRKRLSLILNRVEQAAQGRSVRVLDLCCGGGIITSAIAAMGHSALGYDSSDEEIHLARLFAQKENLERCHFESVNLTQDKNWEQAAETHLQGKPEIVILAYALHHLSEVEGLIQRLGRWLESGTLLIVNEEDPEAVLFQVKHKIRGWLQKDTENEWHKPYREWKALLEAAKFSIEASPKVQARSLWSILFTAMRK